MNKAGWQTHRCDSCLDLSDCSGILWQAVAPRLPIPAAKHIRVDTPSLGASGALMTIMAWSMCKLSDSTVFLLG